MRVLVVEDDENIAAALAAHLERAGHAVDRTPTIAGAWRALQAEAYDVVLLDLGLADGDGSVLLRRVREAPVGRLPDPAMPVLIMTARDEVAARIEVLDQGADDYVTKPFDPDELAARMRVARRRMAGRAQTVLRHGDLEIDPATRTVMKAGRPVELSAREFSILLALVDARPRVLSRAQIEAKLYNFDSALESNAIEVHVHRLRRKLGEGMVRTVRGVGYYVPAEPSP
ncbi:MAG: DNA-binding response regulator [Ramlibacter sp.]|jgi:two-component system response regulator QseB|nr:DNA-binding response regulator [Ramlibacter sp.]MDB5912349.1 DNA-binding response regulator [Ramlibacter sp.]